MILVNSMLDYSTPWSLPDVYLFTGNPIIRLDGGLVMGRGAARQVRDTYPGIDKRFGDLIKKNRDKYVLFLPIESANNVRKLTQFIGWFRVKHHWQHNAEHELIERSSHELGHIAATHSEKTFHINFPGIGNGRLNVHDVMPLLEKLPDNVLIYKA